MNLDQDFFQVSKLSANQKKKRKSSSPETDHFFSPNSSTDLRSDAHQSHIFGGDTSEDHTQIVRGGYSQIIGGIYPPPGFGTPDQPWKIN